MNTDKYEGHADGDWYWNDTGILMDMFGTPIAEMAEGWNTNEATAQLIADAPLLLAEVKRLRKQVEALFSEIRRLEGDDGEWIE